jgi:8-oxo-dGTP diphosphatase
VRGWVDSGMKRIEVVAGIISNKDGDILCTQRNVSPYPYISKKYEFPGGKIEPGETREEALKREIFEELNIDIFIGSFFLRVMLS